MKKLKATNVVTISFFVFFTIVFLVLFGRIIYIQASGNVEGVDLNKWADEQRISGYPINAERGKIYDRIGMVLADNRPTYRIYAVLNEEYTVNEEEPLHVKDPFNTAKQLAPYLNMDVTELETMLSEAQQEGKWQIEFTNVNFTDAQKQEIEKLNLPGIYFIKELERYYPNSVFASHVIGFTQKLEDNQIVGAMGIESSFEDQLSGKDGYISYKHDSYGTKLLNPNETIQKAENGDHVYLTIDQKIQTFLEDAISDVVKQYGPKKIMAVVMNPKTGEVLAMSNRPSFDPNIRENIQNWYNDVIAYPFEPGSTLKIFTLAAAIDSGNYNGNELYESGTYQYLDGVRPIHDHNWGKGWDYISYNEGFLRSSNVAMAKLVWEKMGTETFHQYLQRFDLDKKTGIDLTGETIGTILYNWPSEQVTTSFGQGSTFTPMQLMKAATAVVNNGKMMKPYIISKIVDSSTGKVIDETKPEVVGTPISADTANQVMNLLEQVISNEKGTGYNRYNLDDYSVAGKTGTAQIPDSETGLYMTGRENYVFSFLGMAPAENPELMIYVAVEQPNLKDTETGSEPVSYIFKTVMENSLRYLEIQPDKDETVMDVETSILPSYKGSSTKTVVEKINGLNVHTRVIGNGNQVRNTIPSEGSMILPSSTVLILTDGNISMPDVTGWSLREVLQLGDLLNIKVMYEGSGYTISQSIPKGTEIKKNDTLTIKLEPPSSSENDEQQVDVQNMEQDNTE